MMSPHKKRLSTVPLPEEPAPAPPPLAADGRLLIPPRYRAILLSTIQQRHSAIHQLEALRRQLEALEQQVLNVHGELSGLVKAVAIDAGADPAAVWDLAPDCSHLVKRG